ncbi:hypothetical protein BEWA_009470 [Theileria equi strain WA]|uniref:Cns1/TTC4 wheel domain-containing protein n=1 Tax=Theileria equi strain WA TaxID=1537102 RepID=L0B214_THEEQ|nr:hypothetical protein BEWA_009470 [Theileria equi strain WA]AFZ81533.1 hypothetical protein BEWA_009470 [Theileria equi strain WA]|eukprot:XP_004831199.1 hypothetical protein BEWA_009470 [Theileria equi strain WA]
MDDDDYEISQEYLEKLSREYADIEHPLFMDEIPNDISSNSDLEALYELLAQGETRDSIAIRYKEVGNDYVKDGKRFYEAAISSYTNGIGAESKDNSLNSVLYSNRAFVYLRIGEYVKCVNDCRNSIKLDKSNTKAYYRGAMASFHLSLYKQALLFCCECAKVLMEKSESDFDKATLLDGKNVHQILMKTDENFGNLHNDIIKRIREVEEEKRLLQEKEENEKRETGLTNNKNLASIIKAKGIKLLRNIYNIPQSQTTHFYEKNGSIHTSSLFIYDEMNITDFIQDFDHFSSIGDHLDVMFKDNQYPISFSADNAHAYYQISENELYHFNINEPFENVILKTKILFKVVAIHIVQNETALMQYTIK